MANVFLIFLFCHYYDIICFFSNQHVIIIVTFFFCKRQQKQVKSEIILASTLVVFVIIEKLPLPCQPAQVVKKTENKPKSDKKPMSFSEMAKKPGAPQSKAVINMKYSDKGILKFIIRIYRTESV